MQIDLSNIQSIVVTAVVLLAAISVSVVYNVYFKKWLKLKGYEAAFNRVVVIVRGIEKQAELFGWTSERKKEIAVMMVNALCDALKVKMTDQEIDNLIEAAVQLIKLPKTLKEITEE